MLEKLFRLKENNTTPRREIIGGLTTFMTMSYIIFVQPVVLSAAGMDKNAVFMATCLSSALAAFLMAFLANYPIALAPAMGHNFYFAFVVCLGMGVPWQTALGVNFIAGAAFILLSAVGLREKLITAVPDTLKRAIAVGIGLLIALIGLEWAGLVTQAQGTLIGLGNLKTPGTMLALFGIITTAALMSLRVPGAILIGIILNTILALLLGLSHFQGIVAAPPSIAPTFMQIDLRAALDPKLAGVAFTLFFLAVFDTVGTLIGVGQAAGLLKNGTLPRAKQALLADAIGTTAGTCLGTSTVSSYIESATGVAEGARTGLANVITGMLFLLAIFFSPLVAMISSGIPGANNMTLYPVIAPALIIVGVLMMKNAAFIAWDEPAEAIPAFLTMTLMAFSFSITDGIAFGFISFTLLKCLTGRQKDVPLMIKIFTLLFILRYIWL